MGPVPRLSSTLKKLPLFGRGLLLVERLFNLLRNKYFYFSGRYPLTTRIRPVSASEVEVEGLTVELLGDYAFDRPGHLNSFCKLADQADFLDSDFSQLFAELLQPVGRISRQSWVEVSALMCLQRLNYLLPDVKGLGLGCGKSRVLYYLTRHCRRIVSADLYLSNDPARANTANSDIFKHPGKYAPFGYSAAKLEMLNAAGDKLPAKNSNFDFVLSFAPTEYLGPKARMAMILREVDRVLKPGGHLVLALELVINGVEHPYYCGPDELERFLTKGHSLKMIEDINLSISASTLFHAVNEAEVGGPRDIACRVDKAVCVPLMLVFQKPAVV